MKHYTIQQVSEKLNINKETLRYYDTIQLVSPKRDNNKYRIYSEDDVKDLVCALLLKRSNFSLEEIKQLLKNRKCTNLEHASIKSSRDLLANKKLQLQQSIAFFARIIELLELVEFELAGNSCSGMDALIEQIAFEFHDKGEQV